MPNHDSPQADKRLVASAMVSFIKIGALLILLMWCFDILSPFIGIVSWAVIIAVALYPLHVSLSARLGGREKLSATLLALIAIVIILVPTWIVAESTVSGMKQISENIKDGTASIPAPAESVAQWPVIGGKAYELWSAAAVNLSATLNNFGPQLRSLSQRAMGLAAAGAFTVLQFIASFIIAAALLTTATRSHRFTNTFFGRLLGAERGAEITELSIQTIRSVAKGILGIAFVQAVLAAIGLVVMDVPAAGLWAGAVLVVAIVQLPPIIVLGPIAAWVFSVADPVPAAIFLVYAILVSFSDALLKPLLLGRGVQVPMLVILLGAIGGAISAGLIGLFVGAVVLALGYQIMTAWLAMDDAAQAAPGDAESGS